MDCDVKMIDFFCGVNETQWNHHPVQPGKLACISPVYGKTEQTRQVNYVKIPNDTLVLQDSGAFSDSIKYRLSFSDALERQLNHSQRFNYSSQVIYRASYDLLIDEVWTNGNRHKRRWSENDAEYAVNQTVEAAKYLAQNYNGAKVQSGQGVTPDQYLDCAIRVLEYLDVSQDMFGLGGWCISGKMRSKMMPIFINTINLLFPILLKYKVRKIHIWGVGDYKFLGPLLYECDQYGFKLSTDSSGPQLRPARGRWGYDGWVDRSYVRPHVNIRGLERARHVQTYRNSLVNLRNSRFYHSIGLPDKKKNGQLSLYGTQ